MEENVLLIASKSVGGNNNVAYWMVIGSDTLPLELVVFTRIVYNIPLCNPFIVYVPLILWTILLPDTYGRVVILYV
jgi:hypothetical protein